LAALVEPVESYFLWRPQLRDANDDMVLEPQSTDEPMRS